MVCGDGSGGVGGRQVGRWWVVVVVVVGRHSSCGGRICGTSVRLGVCIGMCTFQ